MADKTITKPEAEKQGNAPAAQAANDSTASVPKTEARAAEQPKKPAAAKTGKKPGAKKKAAPKKRAAKAPVAKARKTASRKSPARTKATRANTGRPAAAKQTAGATAAKAKSNVNQFFKTYNVQTMEDIMTQGKTQFDKLAQDAQSVGKEQLDAIVQSGNIFAKGFENIFKTYVSIAQTSAEKNSQAFQSLLACKTLNEYTETQNKVAQQNFDDFLSGVTRISELSVKVTTDAFEPINDQVSKSIKKASEAVAA